MRGSMFEPRLNFWGIGRPHTQPRIDLVYSGRLFTRAILGGGAFSAHDISKVRVCVSTPVPKEFPQNNSLSVGFTRFAGGRSQAGQ